MMTVAKSMNGFLKHYGEPTHFVKAPEEALTRLSRHLPEALLDYYRRFGFSVFLDGYFQLVNPETYAPALAQWIKGTELEKKDRYHVIFRTGLGNLAIWGEKTGYDFGISVLNDAITLNQRNNADAISKGEANKWAESLLSKVHYKKDDFYGKLFHAAKSRLGPLGPDQMYGLVPAMQVGGAMEAENLQIVSAPEYLIMLAGLSERKILGFDDLVKRAFGAGAVDAAKKALNNK